MNSYLWGIGIILGFAVCWTCWVHIATGWIFLLRKYRTKTYPQEPQTTLAGALHKVGIVTFASPFINPIATYEGLWLNSRPFNQRLLLPWRDVTPYPNPVHTEISKRPFYELHVGETRGPRIILSQEGYFGALVYRRIESLELLQINSAIRDADSQKIGVLVNILHREPRKPPHWKQASTFMEILSTDGSTTYFLPTYFIEEIHTVDNQVTLLCNQTLLNDLRWQRRPRLLSLNR